MQTRMKNPATIVPGAMEAVQALLECTQKSSLPPKTMGLVHLRASQTDGCSPCVVGDAHHAKKGGESDDRLSAVAAWRETPDFTEAVTRLSDRVE